MEELEQLAQHMYENCSPVGKPTWEQLGDVTRGLWLERAQEKLNGPQTTE